MLQTHFHILERVRLVTLQITKLLSLNFIVKILGVFAYLLYNDKDLDPGTNRMKATRKKVVKNRRKRCYHIWKVLLACQVFPHNSQCAQHLSEVVVFHKFVVLKIRKIFEMLQVVHSPSVLYNKSFLWKTWGNTKANVGLKQIQRVSKSKAGHFLK